MVKPLTEIERERRVLHALEGALERSGDDRAKFLEGICGGDEELRLRLERLLAFEVQGELSRPSDLPRVGDLAANELPPGSRIGSYELLQPIARGGMGSVWLARQANPRREVALKVMRPGLWSEDARARFRFESEVLARLRHPGIAQVLEAGVHRDGSAPGAREIPYFALEFVEGARTLGRYVEEERLDRAAVLALFVRILNAVHYGHQKGVVHRDLKPANLLVDMRGDPKVIDFGIARSLGTELERPLETRVGQLIGTLPYMSPEQIAGDAHAIDTRSDVYSLGVVLYEIVCGCLPQDLEGVPMYEAARRVIELGPTRPRALSPDLDRDLEIALLAALEKDPERRYASAAAFAADLERILAHQPIAARPPGRWRRTRLFVRRHRWPVGAGAMVAAALLAATVFSLGFAREARVAAAERQIQLEAARESRAALAAFNAQVVYELMAKLTRLGGSTEARLEVVRLALENLERLEERAGDDLSVRTQLAATHLRVGHVRGNSKDFSLGDRAGAEESYQKALAIVAPLAAQRPADLGAQKVLADAHTALGDLRRDSGDPVGAAERYEQSLEIHRRLVEADPARRIFRNGQARALSDLGTMCGARGEHMRALELFQEGLAIVRELSATESADRDARQELSIFTAKVASATMMSGDALQAAILYREANAIAAELLAEAPTDAVLRRSAAEGMIQLAAALIQGRGDAEEARASAEQGRDWIEDLRTGDPQNAGHVRSLALACFYSGRARQACAAGSGRTGAERDQHLEEARRNFERTLAAIDELDRPGQPLGWLATLRQDARDRSAEVEAALTGG